MNALLLTVVSVDGVFGKDSDDADLSSTGLVAVRIVAVLQCGITLVCVVLYICM